MVQQSQQLNLKRLATYEKPRFTTKLTTWVQLDQMRSTHISL